MRLNKLKVRPSGVGLALALLTVGVLASAQAAGAQTDLFVVNFWGPSLLRYDGVTGALLGEFVTPGSGGLNYPENLTPGPDGNLYVTSYGYNGEGSVKRYDGRTGAFIDDFVPLVPTIPDDLKFGPDGNLYVSDRFTASIHRYNGATGAFIDTFVSDARLGGFIAFAFGPDGDIYASMFNCCFAQRILRFDGTTGAFIDELGEALPPADAAYSGLTFGPDGNLYAGRYHAGRIERFNPVTGAFIDIFVPAGSGGLQTPDYLTFGPDGNLYVSDLNQNGVLRFDGSTGAFIDVFASGGGMNQPGTPTGIAFFSAPTIVDDLVRLAPVSTRFSAASVPGGPAGTFTITGTFTNTSASTIHDPFFEVTQLSGGNLLVNADGGPGGVGVMLTPNVGQDRMLAPGESFTADFVVGLQFRRSFTFFVSLLGVPSP